MVHFFNSGMPLVADVGGCRIGRAPDGAFVVTHQSCPERHWLAANLPTAHALCCELQHGQYGCLPAGQSSTGSS